MLEPELMEEEEQGLVYAQADFSGPNTLFLDLFAENFPHFSGKGTVLDLGCGPADILIRFARKYPGCTCVGIDEVCSDYQKQYLIHQPRFSA
ncbi:MAG: hypothetical protein D3920_04070 [Candidatus Electrothrix sp. AW2]|nr:hypothetical protein [Candidatus Electrothrix gigas]